MAESTLFWIDRIATPIGELALVADEAGALRAVDWTEHTDRTERLLRLHYGSRVVFEPRCDPYSLRRRSVRTLPESLRSLTSCRLRRVALPFRARYGRRFAPFHAARPFHTEPLQCGWASRQPSVR
jgi:hypothetical protein